MSQYISMRIEPLLSPDEFVGIDGVTHLCTGGEAPWLKAQEGVYEEFARLKSAGYAGRAEIYGRGERCRERMGRLWGVPADRIAFMPSAAEGMNWLARGLAWRDGDNVVTTNLEFPSVAYAWRNLRSLGVEVRMVQHRNWIVQENDLLAAVDARTRVLAVSHVSFYTGQCLNLERLSEGLLGKGALFAVDATHSSGVLDVPAGLTDLTVSSSYKWMLATHGAAPCYLSERAEGETESTCFGWHNLAVWPAQRAVRHPEVDEKPMPYRLEPGNPAMMVVMYLDKALEVLLEIGIERIQDHARDLSEEVSIGLEGLGFTVISPKVREARSGNTCFLADDAKGLQNRLAERRVLCWGEYGRVRISTHLYNGSQDVERLLEALSELSAN
jgi:selenocysteine lyase/cysteine desulfurase